MSDTRLTNLGFRAREKIQILISDVNPHHPVPQFRRNFMIKVWQILGQDPENIRSCRCVCLSRFTIRLDFKVDIPVQLPKISRECEFNLFETIEGPAPSYIQPCVYKCILLGRVHTDDDDF